MELESSTNEELAVYWKVELLGALCQKIQTMNKPFFDQSCKPYFGLEKPETKYRVGQKRIVGFLKF